MFSLIIFVAAVGIVTAHNANGYSTCGEYIVRDQ